ncbi:unnamed protein product [Oppiella nova]|uniref:Homeobox domain-containing protein n=1 Tax=Oppiella nova TaxID=334625 RepID=A0A7R9QCG0_9ACAR|nr:unnamed protein product [Oppiella nova]CAG2163115.1 unnamed protein product [Oppiella nova]
MMSYRLSYPLYLDVSDHNKHNPLQINRITGYHSESSTSPATALINLNTFYENMMTSGHNSTITTRSHLPSLGISSNEYYNSSIGGNKKLLPESDSSKSSFSIEAILGINNRQNNNYLSAQDCNQYHLNGIKYRPEYSTHDMYAKASNLSKAKSIASVSPDSTAKVTQSPSPQSSSARLQHYWTIELNSLPNNERKGRSLSIHMKVNNKRSIDCDLNSRVKLEERVIGEECGSHGKSKRVRTIFTPEQLDKLETQFEKQQYMVGPERLYLASTLNLSEAQVKVWFQNRRIKWRKQHQEKEQALIKKQCIPCDEPLHIDSSPIEANSDLCHSSNSLDIIH